MQSSWRKIGRFEESCCATYPGIPSPSSTVEEILEIDLPMHKHCGILPPAEWSGGGTRNTSLRQLEGRRNFISWRLCRAGSMRSVTICRFIFFLLVSFGRRMFSKFQFLPWTFLRGASHPVTPILRIEAIGSESGFCFELDTEQASQVDR